MLSQKHSVTLVVLKLPVSCSRHRPLTVIDVVLHGNLHINKRMNLTLRLQQVSNDCIANRCDLTLILSQNQVTVAFQSDNQLLFLSSPHLLALSVPTMHVL